MVFVLSCERLLDRTSCSVLAITMKMSLADIFLSRLLYMLRAVQLDHLALILVRVSNMQGTTSYSRTEKM